MRGWREKVAIGAVLVGAATAALVPSLKYRDDPLYKGKPISQHLESVNSGFSYGGMTAHRVVGEDAALYTTDPEPPHAVYECLDDETLEAISKEGGNAIPMLLRMLGSKDSRARAWFYSLSQKHWIIKKVFHPRPPHGFTDRARAATVFRLLGPLAADAAPRIVPLLSVPECSLAALAVLSSIQPSHREDILAMTNVLQIHQLPPTMRPPIELHVAAILALASFGDRAVEATPVYLQGLQSSDSAIRAACATALARLRSQPERVVPVILRDVTNYVSRSGLSTDTDNGPSWLYGARCLFLNMWALGEYGGHGVTAVPVLTNLQSSSNKKIRALAELTLQRIKSDTNTVARSRE